MIEGLNTTIEKHRSSVFLFFRKLVDLNRAFILHSDVQDAFDEFSESEAGKILMDTPFEETIRRAQEVVVQFPWIHMSVRKAIGKWEYYRFHVEDPMVEIIPVNTFLKQKERIIEPVLDRNDWALELDLAPFTREFPRIKRTRNIGHGVEFLNRHLSGRLFHSKGNGSQLLFEFLKVHEYRGRHLMLNGKIKDMHQLEESVRKALKYLDSVTADTPWAELEPTLRGFGFEAGWGDIARRVEHTMSLLWDILEAPTPDNLQDFLVRIPMIFSVAILSPHGYFGQANVLGLPDTGGQIVYILDQVRALEHEMGERIQKAGLDIQPSVVVISRLIPDSAGTSCNQRVEAINGTDNAFILRVPFRRENGEIVPYWISRFKVWPYLERFANEAEKELAAELSDRPDLIIGNYSDGNLVASLMAQSMGVTQCNIAHALEKAKYLYSAEYWKENENSYHFSSQFTADLISMNYADFIITSTYQEIAGNDYSPGQYESYQAFTMPDLYRVVNGVDVFDPKFNIVSPGADPRMHFPYTEEDKRFTELHPLLKDLIYKEGEEGTRGQFADPDKPIIFLMSRLDKIKNATGFTEWYGQSDRLRELANLLVVAGSVKPEDSHDEEEIAQIHRMHELMDEYDLDEQVRWVGRQDKYNGAEMYRLAADTRGVFVQPALFEAFGLTVIEAMVSGLPTFATQFGGPLEIIVEGESGFHIDPNDGEETTDKLVKFLEKCRKEEGYWEKLAQGGLKRVKENYTWTLYAGRLMDLARIYGFWKFMTNLERQETRRYLEMFYALQYRPYARRIQA